MYTDVFYEKYIQRLTERDLNASKGDYGRLLIIGGSFGMAGAAFLSGYAAFRSGMGMVRYYGPEENRVILQTLLPEAMYTSESRSIQSVPTGSVVSCKEDLKAAVSWADRIICGPGLSKSENAVEKVRYLFSIDLSDKKLVLLDADCLNIISDRRLPLKVLSEKRRNTGKETNIVITPHVGEMSRLTGKSIKDIKASPSETALLFSEENSCVTVLKDAISFAASPDGRICENNSGHPAMAKAGSGDVLTGVIAGINAVVRADAFESAALGDYIHGKAGKAAAAVKGAHSVLARDIADAVSGIIGHKGDNDGKSI